MQLIKSILFNSLAQVVGKLLAAGTSAAIVILVARNLGPDGLGGFTLMTSYAAMFYMASDFGFNAIVLREAAGKSSELKIGFERLLGLRLAYSLILVFIALSLLSFFPYSAEVKLAAIVAVLTIITQSIYNTANLIFQARLRYDLATVAVAVGSLINLALIYLLIQPDSNLFTIALSYVVGGIATATIGLGLARTLVGSFRPRIEPREWARLTYLTIPLGLTIVFNLIYFRADTFILSFIRPIEEVGIYGAAYKFFELAIVLPAFFMNALYPVLIRYFEENRSKFIEAVRWAILGLAGVGTFAAILGILIAPQLVGLYGGDFGDSVLPLQILFASLPVFFLSGLYMWLMVILRRQKTLAVIYLFGMLLNIALNIYLIPIFSYNAAALTTGISEAVVLALTYYLSRDWQKNEISA